MKKIEAIIRKTKFEDVKDALLEADIKNINPSPWQQMLLHEEGFL